MLLEANKKQLMQKHYLNKNSEKQALCEVSHTLFFPQIE